MNAWMLERRFQISNNGPVVPVRSIVQGKTRKEAQKKANDAAQDALNTLTQAPGKWVSDAILLYKI